jgi:hypothetical protein
MTGPIFQNLLHLGQQRLDFVLGPVEDTRIQSQTVRGDAFKHVQLLVASKGFQFGVFGPGTERQLFDPVSTSSTLPRHEYTVKDKPET